MRAGITTFGAVIAWFIIVVIWVVIMGWSTIKAALIGLKELSVMKYAYFRYV